MTIKHLASVFSLDHVFFFFLWLLKRDCQANVEKNRMRNLLIYPRKIRCLDWRPAGWSHGIIWCIIHECDWKQNNEKTRSLERAMFYISSSDGEPYLSTEILLPDVARLFHGRCWLWHSVMGCICVELKNHSQWIYLLACCVNGPHLLAQSHSRHKIYLRNTLMLHFNAGTAWWCLLVLKNRHGSFLKSFLSRQW